MSKVKLLPVDRFLQTLEIVYREGLHLSYSWGRVYSQPIDTSWVKDLDTGPEIADRLLPRWLIALAETPGSQIETLNRAEKLGVVESVERWLEARALRNRLVHEYIGRADDMIVVETADVTRGDDVFMLSENESTYIPVGTNHRLENPGTIPLEIIEVQSGSYLGEDDIVRFEYVYNRAS